MDRVYGPAGGRVGPHRGSSSASLQKSGLRMGEITHVICMSMQNWMFSPSNICPIAREGNCLLKYQPFRPTGLCVVQIYLFAFRVVLVYWKVAVWSFFLHLSWRHLFFFQLIVGNTPVLKNGNSFEGTTACLVS